MPETTAEKSMGRIAGVDTLGFVDELDKQLAKDLRTEVKVRMVGRSLDVAQGDFFEGKLYTSTPGSIDPAKWLKLYEDGKIKKAEFLAALTVGRDKAKKVLGDNAVDRLTTFGSSSTKLTIARIVGVEPTLAEAIKALTAAAAGK